MTSGERTIFTEETLVFKQTRSKRDGDEKVAAGYDSMYLKEQLRYMSSLLDFKVRKNLACTRNRYDISCQYAVSIRKREEELRNSNGYYWKN